MKRCQVCARLLNVPERMNRFMLIHILMCLYPQSHSRESDPYLNQRYYVIILLSCENFECLSRLPIPHTVVPCLIMTCHYPQILLLERFCQSWRDTTAREDHVQRQEQARGSSRAELLNQRLDLSASGLLSHPCSPSDSGPNRFRFPSPSHMLGVSKERHR